jgi:hypothetical protein
MSVSQPRIIVVGLASWSNARLLDAMAAAWRHNRDRGYERLEDCPGAWRSYCEVLAEEHRMRGEQLVLFA